MISSIFSFELKYRFKNPLTYLILLMMAGQGLWYTLGIYDYYTSDEALLNGAGIFYQCLAGGGMLVVAVVAMISGTTLHRDVAVGSADYVYACPLDEKRFFITHFFVAYSINLLLVGAYPLGMALIQYSGLGEPHLFGPTPWLQLIHGYFIFCIPNLFLLTAVCFFCLVYMRRMSAAYMGVTAVTILFVVSEVMSDNSHCLTLLEIMDPLGYVYAKSTVQLMPVIQKNSGFLPLTAAFWFNRLLWLSLGIIALYFSHKKFSFQYFLQIPPGKHLQKNTQKTDPNPLTGQIDSPQVPGITCNYTAKENFSKVLRLATTEFLSVVRPTSFKIIFALLVFIVLMQDLFWTSTYYVGHQVPLTSGMCNARLANGFLFMVVLMLLSGELFFKERTSGFWQITGTTPAPTWVLQAPKLLAMAGTAFLFAFTIFLGGVCAQLLQGFQDINLLLYITDIFGYKFGWITYVFNIILVFFLASLFGNRYLTHIVAIGYYLFMIISFDVGLIEQVRFGYALTPGVEDYSEMMGYGIWERASFWFFLMWTSLATFFVLAAIQFWRRGTGQRLFDVKRLVRGALPFRAKAIALVSMVVFFLLQGYIVASSTNHRNYISSEQADTEASMYEKTYALSAGSNQFVQELYEVRIDLHPRQRKAEYAVTVGLTNLSTDPVDHLYLNVDSHTDISVITLQHQPLEPVQRKVDLGMSVYRLPEPLNPGEKALLFIDAVRSYQGFVQTAEEPQADLAFNGLFFTKAIPFIGFDQDKSLLDNRDREIYHLKKLTSRLAPIDDPHGLSQGFISPWVQPENGHKVNITVSTTARQQPFAPGKLIRSWQENGRNYAFFQVNTPVTVQPYIGSAHYLNHRTTLEDVEVTLMHHPAHNYNLKEFEGAIKAGLQFINKNLGTYPYPQLRVGEIPYYQEDSYAMANAIALSEKEGWYADSNVDEIQGFIQYVLAREMIRQWIAANGFVADVQGADMLWTALPSALALQIVDSRMGSDQVKQLFVKMRRKYHKNRNNEPNKEPSLLFGDHIEYLEANKGTMALYKLAGEVGFDNFNKFVRTWITDSSGPLVFKDLYMSLQKIHELGPDMRNLFEQVDKQIEL